MTQALGKDCIDCRRVSKDFKIYSNQPNAFVIHVDVGILKGTDRKAIRNLARHNLCKTASALRNYQGGAILVHLFGQTKGDPYLGHLDELIGPRFTFLIEDEQLFVNIYKRCWLNKHTDFTSEKDFVHISVTKTRGISTVDFKTKIRNDFENIQATPANILHLLTALVPRERRDRVIIRKKPDPLQESRHIEFKSISKCKVNTLDPNEFVDFVWEKLKLKENVTAFSKIEGGGSFFVGIGEIPDTKPYPSKTHTVEGFKIDPDQSAYKRHFQGKIKNDILVLKNNMTFSDPPEDLIQAVFHKTGPSTYFLEVSVRYFDGIVFYDKKGPEAYTITEGEIRRMEPEEWLERVPFEYLVCPLLVT